MKKCIALILSFFIVMSFVNLPAFAAAVEVPESLSELNQYLQKTMTKDDGTIGIPVNFYTYYDSNKSYTGGPKGSNIVLYVINTNTERTGTDSDEDIIKRFLDRDCIVIVLDYLNNSATCGQALSESVDLIRRSIPTDASYVNNIVSSPENCYVAPSGYDIDFKVKFFSYDEYGCAGDMEWIVDVWKNDFSSNRRNDKIIVDGKEMTVWEYTNSFTAENPMTIYDCLNPDGTPLDFNLYMDIIYPTNPRGETPVMVQKNSSNSRPSLFDYTDHEFVFRYLFGGYAYIIADYMSVPMYDKSRSFGNFQGTPGGNIVNSVSGFNQTYSLGIFDEVKADTALMRKIRLLADPTDENREFQFDVNAIGVCGLSKGAHFTRLANPEPETTEPQRYHEGHVGESRYEALYDEKFNDLGYVDPYVNNEKDPNNEIIRLPKPQPFTEYSDGSKIPSQANLIYPAVGLGAEKIVKGSSPIFNTGTMQSSGSYYGEYLKLLGYANSADVPCINLVCPDLGHKFGKGIDRDHGVDVIQALYDMTDYYLKGNGAKCLYVDVDEVYESDVNSKITFQFTGAIPESELEKITIVNTKTTKAVKGEWISSYGDLTWEFVPHTIEDGYEYKITVPNTIVCENGKNLQETFVKSFSTKIGERVDAKIISSGEITNENAAYVLFPDKDYLNSSKTIFRISILNDAANTLEVYALKNINSSNIANSEIGDKLGEIKLVGKGDYSFDVTDYCNSSVGDVGFKLITKNDEGIVELNSYDASAEDKTLSQVATGSKLMEKSLSTDTLPDGDGEYLKLDYYLRLSNYIDLDNNLSCNPVVVNSPFISNSVGFKSGALTEDDYGRRLRFTCDYYDTTSRMMYATLTGGGNTEAKQIDDEGTYLAFKSTPNKWDSISMEYVVNQRDWEVFNKKTVTVYGENKGSAVIADKVAVDVGGFAAGSGSKGSSYAGVQGLNDTYTIFKNIDAAKEAGAITVLHEAPIYFDNFKFEEIFTDATLAVADSDMGNAPSLILSSYDETENVSELGTYIENGDNIDTDFSEENIIVVDSGDLSYDEESIKSYSKFSLSGYYGGVANVRVNCVEGSDCQIKVYGVKDAGDGQNWTSATINYFNAPANDTLGYDVLSDEVYKNIPIATFTAKTGTSYNIDVTSFAREMHKCGAGSITLIFVCETPGKKATLSLSQIIETKQHANIDFTDYTLKWTTSVGAVSDANAKPSGTSDFRDVFTIATESGGNKALNIKPWSVNNEIRLIGTLNSSRINEFDEDDLGKVLKVNFRAKADVASSSLTFGYVAELNGADPYQPKVCSFPKADEWYDFSYEITIDENMLSTGSDGSSINLPTFRTTGIPTEYRGTKDTALSDRMNFYIDDIIITEENKSEQDFTALKKHFCQDFSDYTLSWTTNNTGTDATTATPSGTDGFRNVFTIAEEADGNKALNIKPYNRNNEIRLIGTLNSSRRNEFTASDLGKILKVNFRAKADVASSSFTLGYVAELSSVGKGTPYQPKVCSFPEANKWYDFSYEITIDDYMLGNGSDGSSVNLPSFKTTGVPTDYIGTKDTALSERMNFYIDDIVIEEASDADSLNANIGIVNSDNSNVNYAKCESSSTLTPFNSGVTFASGRKNALYLFDVADYSLCDRIRFSVDATNCVGDTLTIYAKAVDSLPGNITWNTSMTFTSSDIITKGYIQGEELSIDVTDFAKENSNKKLLFMIEASIPDESFEFEKTASLLYGNEIAEVPMEVGDIIYDAATKTVKFISGVDYEKATLFFASYTSTRLPELSDIKAVYNYSITKGENIAQAPDGFKDENVVVYIWDTEKGMAPVSLKQ